MPTTTLPEVIALTTTESGLISHLSSAEGVIDPVASGLDKEPEAI